MQELEDCLVRDYFICYHIIQGIHSIDFLEVFVYLSIYLSIYVYITIFIGGTTITKTLMFQGSRTKLFEKGKKPKVQKTAIFVLYRKYLAPFIFLL